MGHQRISKFRLALGIISTAWFWFTSFRHTLLDQASDAIGIINIYWLENFVFSNLLMNDVEGPTW